MKAMLLALALGAASPPGQAPVPYVVNPVTTICLDPAGRMLPVRCKTNASRIKYEEYICQCLRGGDHVKIPVCPDGVSPPPESADYELARLAAVRNGSLVGATYEGRPICGLRP